MKYFLFYFTMFLSISKMSNAQGIDFPKSGTFEKVIGNINGNDFYLLKNEYFFTFIFKYNKDKFLSQSEFQGSYKIGSNNVIYKEYKDWFICEDKIYSLVQNNYQDEVHFQLYQYDENLIVKDSLIIFQDSIRNVKNLRYNVKQINNQIGIIGTTNIKKKESFFLIFDLNTHEKSIYNFKIEEKQNFTCSDFTFNDKHDFFAVYEGEENTNIYPKTGDNKLDPIKLKSVLVCGSKTNLEISEIKSINEETFLRSFKFNGTKDQAIILGALVFSSIGAMPLAGYQTIKLNFGNPNIIDIKTILGAEINNSINWSSADNKTLNNDKLTNNSHFQFLKEIINLEDGKFLFVSEYNYITGGSAVDFNGGPTTVSGGGISSTSGAGSIITSGVSYSSNGNTASTGKLIVSNIDTNSNSMIWSAATKNRNRLTYPFVDYKFNYFFDLNLNLGKITFYYEEIPENFDETGNLIEKHKFSAFNSKENTIAKFEINLADGLYSLKELKPLLTEDKRHILSVGSSHIIDDENLIFLTYIKKNHRNFGHQIYLNKR